MMKRFSLVIAAMLLLASLQAEAQTTWFKYAGNPVLTNGAPGSWESYNVWQARVIRIQDTLKMFYTGDTGIEAQPQIGLAWSIDGGVNWTKYASNPVMGPTQAWEGTWVYSPSVIFTENEYKMWYTGNYNQATRLGYAHSSDGIHWSKCAGNPVLGVGPSAWDGLSVQFPSVMADTTGFRMWYSGAVWGGSPIQIGYATAVDETTWTKPNGTSPVLAVGSSGSWDALALRSPAVIFDEGIYRMWYTGGLGAIGLQFGVAMSSDGLQWTKDAQNNPVVRPGPSACDAGGIASCDVLSDGSLYHMWYGGGSQNIFGTIGYAVSPKGFVASVIPARDTVDRTRDTVRIRVQVADPRAQSYWAIIRPVPFGENVMVKLFDDGSHGDSLSGDGLFANSWIPGGNSRYSFSLRLALHDTLIFSDISIGDSKVITAVRTDEPPLPQAFALEQNYPNPFNPSTRITYAVAGAGVQGPGASNIRLVVYDLLGKEVAVLVDEPKLPGRYEAYFDGSALASGVYFYRLTAGDFIQTRKMIAIH